MSQSIVSDILITFIVLVLAIAGTCIFAYLRARLHTRPPDQQ